MKTSYCHSQIWSTCEWTCSEITRSPPISSYACPIVYTTTDGWMRHLHHVPWTQVSTQLPTGNYRDTVLFHLPDTMVVCRKSYPMSWERTLRRDLQTLVHVHVTQLSISIFALSITIIPKVDGTFWLCADYCRIIQQTELFPRPMPCTGNIIEDIGDAPCSHVWTVQKNNGRFCNNVWHAQIQ